MVISEEAQKRKRVTLENLHERVAEGKIRELKIILKADVQGSVQALRDSLERMSTNEIRLNVIHSGVGGINETDVTLASASDAVIIGFSVRADAKSEEAARKAEVEIKTYRIIYEAIADVRAAMEGLLEPEKTEIRLGRAEIRTVYKFSKGGTIGGSFVLEGKIVRGAKARVLRDGVVVHEGSFWILCTDLKMTSKKLKKALNVESVWANSRTLKPKISSKSIPKSLKLASLNPRFRRASNFMSIRRQERVTELIHQEISKKIPLLKDPGLGFITVLAVRLSADFKLAKVYYSVLGTPG